jgi:hypothetical protein
MNSQFLLEKLENSEEYQKFMKENQDAYLCSAFFIIDFETEHPENKFHFDYYLPSSKKTFSFELEIENEIKLTELERFEEKIFNKVSTETHFDFDEIYEKIKKEMETKKISNKIQKMIFSLQNFENKDTLFGTIMLSGLSLIKMTFDPTEDKIIDFEKKSFFDMMKIVKKGD